MTNVIRGREGVAVGEVRGACVVVWRGNVVPERFEVQRQGLTEVTRRHPDGVGFLCIVEPTSGAPDDRLRRASVDMVRALEPQLRCIACVVEGSGFGNAVARSALSAMTFLLPRRHTPLSVFGTVNAAAAWMGPHLKDPDTLGLARAVAQLRTEMAPILDGAPAASAR